MTQEYRKCKTKKCNNQVPARGYKYCHQCRTQRAAKARQYRASSSHKSFHLRYGGSFAAAGPVGPSVSFSNPAPAGVGVNASYYQQEPRPAPASSKEQS